MYVVKLDYVKTCNYKNADLSLYEIISLKPAENLFWNYWTLLENFFDSCGSNLIGKIYFINKNFIKSVSLVAFLKLKKSLLKLKSFISLRSNWN